MKDVAQLTLLTSLGNDCVGGQHRTNRDARTFLRPLEELVLGRPLILTRALDPKLIKKL